MKTMKHFSKTLSLVVETTEDKKRRQIFTCHFLLKATEQNTRSQFISTQLFQAALIISYTKLLYNEKSITLNLLDRSLEPNQSKRFHQQEARLVHNPVFPIPPIAILVRNRDPRRSPPIQLRRNWLSVPRERHDVCRWN